MKIKVGIDPGHGGSDSGATGKTKSGATLLEKNVNLVMALACGEYLTSTGLVEVYYTRTDDRYLSLSKRAQLLNDWKVDYAISIHNNAATGKADGFEAIHTIFTSGEGDELAKSIATHVEKLTGQNLRRVFSKANSKGTDYYAMNRLTRMATVITEGAFLDNPDDNVIVDTVTEQKSFGIAIACGVIAHALPFFSDHDLPLIGQTQSSYPQMADWAIAQHSAKWFVSLASVYEKYGELTGLRADVMYAQLAYHTSFGHNDDFAARFTYVLPNNERFSGASFESPLLVAQFHFGMVCAIVGIDPLIDSQHWFEQTKEYIKDNKIGDIDLRHLSDFCALFDDMNYATRLINDCIKPMLKTEVTGNVVSNTLYDLAIEQVDALQAQVEHFQSLLRLVENFVNSFDSFKDERSSS